MKVGVGPEIPARTAPLRRRRRRSFPVPGGAPRRSPGRRRSPSRRSRPLRRCSPRHLLALAFERGIGLQDLVGAVLRSVGARIACRRWRTLRRSLQRRASAPPQPPQKRLPAGFWCPQAGPLTRRLDCAERESGRSLTAGSAHGRRPGTGARSRRPIRSGARRGAPGRSAGSRCAWRSSGSRGSRRARRSCTRRRRAASGP